MGQSVQCIFDSALSRRSDALEIREVDSVVALSTLFAKFASGQVSNHRLYRLKGKTDKSVSMISSNISWLINRLCRIHQI